MVIHVYVMRPLNFPVQTSAPPFPTPQSMPHFMLVAFAITTENGGYMQFKVTLILQAL